MLDFRRRTRSASYVEGKQQLKLLGLMLTAGLLVFLISTASNPARWNWMFVGSRDGGNTDQTSQTSTRGSSDTRLASRMNADEPLGTFVSPPDGLPSAQVKEDEYFPGVRTDYLQTVRDDTIFRRAEADAWFHLFELLSRTPSEKIANAASEPVGFRQLYQQPKAYRGRLVNLEGTVRGVSRKEAPENSYDIKDYYQISIEPKGEPDELVVAYVLDLPEGFPTTSRLAEPITLHGFFFKRWAYEAKDAIRTAPLLVAKSFIWKPQVTAPVETTPPATSFAILITATLVVLAILGFWVTRPRRSIAMPDSVPEVRFSESMLAALADSDRGEAEVPAPRDKS